MYHSTTFSFRDVRPLVKRLEDSLIYPRESVEGRLGYALVSLHLPHYFKAMGVPPDIVRQLVPSSPLNLQILLDVITPAAAFHPVHCPFSSSSRSYWTNGRPIHEQTPIHGTVGFRINEDPKTALDLAQCLQKVIRMFSLNEYRK